MEFNAQLVSENFLKSHLSLAGKIREEKKKRIYKFKKKIEEKKKEIEGKKKERKKKLKKKRIE